MNITLDTKSLTDYRKFLRIKSLPAYSFTGHVASVPDEYAESFGLDSPRDTSGSYKPLDGLFDYQRDITRLAIRKRKFAVFAQCGLGKTLMLLEFARHASKQVRKQRTLIVSPHMVVAQTVAESKEFYLDKLPIEIVRAADLQAWLNGKGGGIGITNYEALRDDVTAGNLGALILDESSYLKSHYGKWGQKCIELGAGLNWKLALTGTPAPNDRIEFANHAVFLDHFPNVNAFLAKFFVNRGQTGERWELRPHALRAFYTALSHWCIFLESPATYGWQDNVGNVPPIHVHIHHVDLTSDQESYVQSETGELFAARIGGIGSRSKLGQIAKGTFKGQEIATNKPDYIKALVASWPEESTIIWCLYDAEQDIMEKTFPDAVSLRGATPMDERMAGIEAFKSGAKKIIISKSKVLGFGLNLQKATRHVFSGLQDSYEQYWQCVKRSNRIGSTLPLNVHIPVTDLEVPMIETVLAKARRIESDAAEQEALFRSFDHFGFGR
jgi:hypothetical protein